MRKVQLTIGWPNPSYRGTEYGEKLVELEDGLYIVGRNPQNNHTIVVKLEGEREEGEREKIIADTANFVPSLSRYDPSIGKEGSLVIRVRTEENKYFPHTKDRKVEMYTPPTSTFPVLLVRRDKNGKLNYEELYGVSLNSGRPLDLTALRIESAEIYVGSLHSRSYVGTIEIIEE